MRNAARILLLVTLSVPVYRGEVSAQFCLPRDEPISITFEGARLGTQGEGGMRVAASPVGHVVIGAAFVWGGHDTGAEAAATTEVSFAGRFGAGPLTFCPLVGWTATRYEFRERLDADLGSVAQTAYRAGLRLTGPILATPTARFGWRAEFSTITEGREIGRRRWVLEVPPRLVIETEDEREVRLAVELAATFRRGPLGLAFGLRRNHDFDRRTRYGIEVTWYLAKG